MEIGRGRRPEYKRGLGQDGDMARIAAAKLRSTDSAPEPDENNHRRAGETTVQDAAVTEIARQLSPRAFQSFQTTLLSRLITYHWLFIAQPSLLGGLQRLGRRLCGFIAPAVSQSSRRTQLMTWTVVPILDPIHFIGNDNPSYH